MRKISCSSHRHWAEKNLVQLEKNLDCIIFQFKLFWKNRKQTSWPDIAHLIKMTLKLNRTECCRFMCMYLIFIHYVDGLENSVLSRVHLKNEKRRLRKKFTMAVRSQQHFFGLIPTFFSSVLSAYVIRLDGVYEKEPSFIPI